MGAFEQYRPLFHFSPPKMWMNDPNGLVYDQGVYHLYYQHNPFSKDWGPMHWGHAVSRDLMHWQHLGIVMAPDELGAIFSGSAISVPAGETDLLPQGGLAYFFTHCDEKNLQQQSLSTSVDGGMTLIKYPGNPIIANSELNDFRDPKVFWQESHHAWSMIVAGGPVRMYRSSDLVHWIQTQQIDEINTECPDLFPLTLGGKTYWVLSRGGVSYHLGDFDGERYIPLEGPFLVDGGDSFYAVQSYSGVEGRTLWMGWMSGASTRRLPIPGDAP